MKPLLICTALFFGVSSYAQDSTKRTGLTVTGAVDAYYRFNFHNAKDSGFTNNYTSFTNSQNSFELGMASVKADYAIGKVDGLIDLGFGRRAEEFSYNDGDGDQGKNGFITLANVKQAFLSYAPFEKIKFTLGKFMTHLGFEVCDAYLNRNYSMDYMFSYGPFFHTGIKADATLSKNFAFMLGIANPTDMSTASFSHKHIIGQIHVTSTDARINGYINYMGGKDLSKASVNEIDGIFSAVLSSKFSVGYNGAVRMVKRDGADRHSWWGSALYLNYDPSTIFGLTARGEYFSDEHSIANIGGLGGNKVFDFTLSGNIHVDNLTIIPEFRLDAAEEPIFFKNSDRTFPTAKSTGTGILAVTYHF
jgi:hypothetical protein